MIVLPIALWILFWWGYAFYQLCVPADGDRLFHHQDTAIDRMCLMIVWASLIFLAPAWCPIYLFFSEDAP